MNDIFSLEGRVAVITGGAGFLGQKHAEAVASRGGIPVLVDLAVAKPEEEAVQFAGGRAMGLVADITNPDDVQRILGAVLAQFNRIDILINNAANNPRMEASSSVAWSRLENFPTDLWNADLAVGLTGAFLCSRILGAEMARRKQGVIINVASDLGIIAPDQRLYRKEGLPEEQQPVKPVTYSVVKTGLIGLTRYLATYWAECGVRANAISPGGVYNGQPDDFVDRLARLIPMKRMAHIDEYQGAIIFLCSDASSYMTGANLIIDGGRTCW